MHSAWKVYRSAAFSRIVAIHDAAAVGSTFLAPPGSDGWRRYVAVMRDGIRTVTDSTPLPPAVPLR